MFGRCAYWTIGIRYFVNPNYTWTTRYQAIQGGVSGCTTTLSQNGLMCNIVDTSSNCCTTSVIPRGFSGQADWNAGLPNRGVYWVLWSINSNASAGSLVRFEFVRAVAYSVFKVWTLPGGTTTNQEWDWPSVSTPNKVPFGGYFYWVSNCTFTAYYIVYTSIIKKYSDSVTTSDGYGFRSYPQQPKNYKLYITNPTIDSRGANLFNGREWGGVITPCSTAC